MLLVTVMCCSIYKARAMPNYRFTVKELLKAAGINRSSCRDDECGANQTDHIVELQLVVAALNDLPDTAYWGRDWESRLVTFFDQEQNKQCLAAEINHGVKKTAVGKLIRLRRNNTPRNQWSMSQNEWYWIRVVMRKWDEIRGDLRGFEKFKDSLDEILNIDQ